MISTSRRFNTKVEKFILIWEKMAADFHKITALASLTATYTDSENEQESDLELEAGPIEKIPSRDSSPFSAGERYTKDAKRSKLVSYSETWEEDRIDSEDSPNSESDDQDERSTDSKKSVEADSIPHSPVSFHRSLLLLRSEEINLPPEPSGRCSNTLQEKITELYEMKNRDGKDMNASIQRRKDFRNPSIYEKLIAYCGIDEQGTNYPPEIYDPHSWGTESFYDELAKRQKEEMDKREKEKKERTKVEFISGTAKKSAEAGVAENGKRKSKWDIGAAQTIAMPTLKPATLITNPSGVFPVAPTGGTKPTIISAFGTITKKAKQ